MFIQLDLPMSICLKIQSTVGCLLRKLLRIPVLIHGTKIDLDLVKLGQKLGEVLAEQGLFLETEKEFDIVKLLKEEH